MKRGDLVRYCGAPHLGHADDNLGIIIGSIRHRVGDHGVTTRINEAGKKVKVMHPYVERVYFEVLWLDGLRGSYTSHTLEVLSEAG